MEKEVLIYCPSCSRQIVAVKSQIGENMVCQHCGYPFVAKAPKKYSENIEQLKKLGKILGAIAVLMGAFLLKDFVKEYCLPFVDSYLPGGEKREYNRKVRSLVNDYVEHMRRFAGVFEDSNLATIYTSKTGKELKGEINPQKYRKDIEDCLREATCLNSWSKENIDSLDTSKFKGDKVDVVKVECGRTFRELCNTAYTLSTATTNLLVQTLECHQICCGASKDASESDKAAYEAYCQRLSHDFFGRKLNLTEERIKSSRDFLCHLVYQTARKYSDLEGEKIKELQSLRGKLIEMVN